MNCFGDWFAATFPHLAPPRKPARSGWSIPTGPVAAVRRNLPDGLYESSGGFIYAYCRSCGCSYQWDGDQEGFDPDMSYCGGSPSCCP